MTASKLVAAAAGPAGAAPAGADARVTTALTHWAGRMVANGVPFSDLEHIRASVSDWAQWCEAFSVRARIHEQLGEAANAEGKTLSAGEHWTRAAACYHFAKFLFFDDVEAAAAAGRRAVECRTQSLRYLDPPGERIGVPFEGTVLPGNLRLPRGAGPWPLVVMIMGLDSAKEEMHFHEQDFLRRGMATFAFDGPGQGEVEHDLPIRADYEVPVTAVIDVMSKDSRIDPTRLGLWGVSLGGYYAPRAAAGELRVRACVSLSGPFDFGESWSGLPDLTREAFRIRSHSDTSDLAQQAAARLSLDGVAEKITCPLLVVSGGRDRLFGPDHAQRLVAQARGPVDHLHIEDGSHVVNNLPHRYRPQSADWLAAALDAHPV